LTLSSSNSINRVESLRPGTGHFIRLRFALVVAAGLAAAQSIAAVHIHSSNLALYDKMDALRHSGYLIIPNSHVLPRLLEWNQAFLGGIFYTLTIGAFLTLLSIAAAWIRHRVLPERMAFSFLFLIPWLALLIALNIPRFTAMGTLYFLVIPPLVFSSASRCLFKKSHGTPSRTALFHAAVPLLLAFLWSSQMDDAFFTDVRDYLLLSHSTGTKVNDFYYRYTLYPAEAFKSLDQKSMKTVFLEDIRNKPLARALAKSLIELDYLTVQNGKVAELIIRQNDHELHLRDQGASVLSAKLQDFLSSPARWLADFSARTDGNRFFRKITFVSLLIGFPLLIYLLLWGIFVLLPSPLLAPRIRSSVATSLCLSAGIVLFLFFLLWRGAVRSEDQVQRALRSEDSMKRVAALKFIESRGIEITRYPDYRDIMDSPSIPEKYWLVKNLARSKGGTSFEDLLSFLDDAHPTVVYATYQALEKRRNPGAIPHILSRIEMSTHWYTQWNAYRALRSLGWKQSGSK